MAISSVLLKNQIESSDAINEERTKQWRSSWWTQPLHFQESGQRWLRSPTII